MTIFEWWQPVGASRDAVGRSSPPQKTAMTILIQGLMFHPDTFEPAEDGVLLDRRSRPAEGRAHVAELKRHLEEMSAAS